MLRRVFKWKSAPQAVAMMILRPPSLGRLSCLGLLPLAVLRPLSPLVSVLQDLTGPQSQWTGVPWQQWQKPMPNKSITSFLGYTIKLGQVRGGVERLLPSAIGPRAFFLGQTSCTSRYLFFLEKTLLRTAFSCYSLMGLRNVSKPHVFQSHTIKGHPWPAAVNTKYKTQVKSCLPGDTGALEFSGTTQRWHPPAASR